MEGLQTTLLNVDGSAPLAKRFRALFAVKALASQPSSPSQAAAINILAEASHLSDIVPLALRTLIQVLEDVTEDRMVRHEAAEAIGAIGAEGEGVNDRLELLRKYRTCEIAIDRIVWELKQKESAAETITETSSYASIDPAPPSASEQGSSSPGTISELQKTLLDKSAPLFERYRAMFSLRNIGSDEAVDALASGFVDDSVLFKHEIAFIFGQMVHTHSIPALLERLKDEREDEMVRHEAAEALGSLATPEILPILQHYASKEAAVPEVVRESCEVAVDMWEYENSGDFQYAETFSAGSSASKPVEVAS
ncbi:ARM repeat-containing protein [Flagelloscypha sp. PMI_526]|nr:ARM repeat-containing protein [Flagelloscypha sp. PMI_526]